MVTPTRAKQILLALFLVLAMHTTAAALPDQTAIPEERLSAVAQYTVPPDWEEEFSTNQGDPQSILSHDLHEITIRLSGGDTSRYETVDDFLRGFAARSHNGEPVEKVRETDVSGIRVTVYRRAVIVSLPPPGISGPMTFTSEEFCVVPVGEMFFVLRYSFGDSIPDISYDGHEVWLEFLKNFRTMIPTTGG